MSLGDFLAMGGYGFYVWGSYLVTALVLVVEILAVRSRYKAAQALSKELEQ
ncbi:MAG TPA: heme exporter protein CcmD [Casimicrobiaceae bacterium]|nr:heme exporter protein CcmD [Casimicrobiaceae bacterium]